MSAGGATPGELRPGEVRPGELRVIGTSVTREIDLLLDRLALGIMVGSTVGLVLGFYLLYVQYFKPR